MNQSYEFADLNEQENLLLELRALEKKIEQQIGKTINLIAYTPVEENGGQQSPSL